ncbi:Uncharacterised protein [Mycobacterium tuberculosis]|uniref:Uncharacterized protein n=1 Tax=Mycobacterium tuberculosis TaxID=1773 RepID=A0A655IGA9_MYCTX|nr:Uncharacterised protein [Mycobacterium tuberculosis]COV83526.1 Uncharacterised protein [Mycobacterium tuberculosis]
MHDVKHSGDTGLVDPAEPQRTGQGLLEDVVGQDALRVDEGQRHLAVQRCVKRLPELQGWYTPVEDQQAVAAVSDAGAGNQLHIIWGGRRFSVRFAERVERNRPTGRIGGQIAVLQVGWVRPGNGAGVTAGWRVELKLVGDGPRQLGTRRGTKRGVLRRAVDHLRSFRSPGSGYLLRRPAPDRLVDHTFPPRRGQTPPLRVRDRSGARRLIQDILGLRPGLQAPAPDSGSHGIQRRPRLGHPCAEGDRSQNWQHDESQHRQPQQRTDAARVGRQLA